MCRDCPYTIWAIIGDSRLSRCRFSITVYVEAKGGAQSRISQPASPQIVGPGGGRDSPGAYASAWSGAKPGKELLNIGRVAYNLRKPWWYDH